MQLSTIVQTALFMYLGCLLMLYCLRNQIIGTIRHLQFLLCFAKPFYCVCMIFRPSQFCLTHNIIVRTLLVKFFYMANFFFFLVTRQMTCIVCKYELFVSAPASKMFYVDGKKKKKQTRNNKIFSPPLDFIPHQAPKNTQL